MADTPEVEKPELEHPGVECPECGDLIIGRGRMPDRVYLGLHRKKEHGVQGTSSGSVRARTKRQTPRGQRVSEVRPMSLVTSAGREVKGKGAPSPAQLGGALGKLYGHVTVIGASVVADADPRLTDEQRDALVEHLSASPEEARDTMAPIGRVLARTELSKRYGRGAIDNMDVLDSVAAIAAQVQRWRTYMREARAGQAPAFLIAPGPTADLGPNIAAAPAPDIQPEGYYTPPERQGVIVTPSMLGRTDLERRAAELGDPQ